MGKKERERTPSQRTLKQINQSHIFSPRCLFSLSNIMAERGRDEREKQRREGKWLVRARLVPREHNDIGEPVNGDEWLKWSGALARSPLGVFNQQPHLSWLLALWAQRHNGAFHQNTISGKRFDRFAENGIQLNYVCTRSLRRNQGLFNNCYLVLWHMVLNEHIFYD